MEWSKIKNIVLLMLLAVNLFLLVLVADQERKSAAYQEEARTGAVEILEKTNIHMDLERLPPESDFHTMAVERDRTMGDADILIATANGQGSRFAESDVRIMGRAARGVTGIRLRPAR